MNIQRVVVVGFASVDGRRNCSITSCLSLSHPARLYLSLTKYLVPLLRLPLYSVPYLTLLRALADL